ncbi:MAG: HAD-IIIA family hydrolase [Acidobacteria bacterium]|nr:HAD-IIIA family hydrolase [Acidobacteriota bacterium]
MLKPAVFVDRDGVLVKPILRDGIPYAPLRWEDFELFPGAAEAVGALKAAGLFVVVVTNQPEVRRGTLDPALLDAFHQRLRESVPVDAILDCRHDDRDRCDCRKPRPGLILEAARRYELDLQRSCLAGDTERDLGAAHAAGLPLVLLDAPYNQPIQSDYRVPDLGEAVRVILKFLLQK